MIFLYLFITALQTQLLSETNLTIMSSLNLHFSWLFKINTHFLMYLLADNNAILNIQQLLLQKQYLTMVI